MNCESLCADAIEAGQRVGRPLALPDEAVESSQCVIVWVRFVRDAHFEFSRRSRSVSRSSGCRRLEAHPPKRLKGDFRPLMSLVGADELTLGTNGDCPARNHPCRNSDQHGENHECAAEAATRAFPALKPEPVNGVSPASANRYVYSNCRKRFDRLGLAVGCGLP